MAHNSAFCDYQLNGRFYGGDYDVEETQRFHAAGRHEYILCRSAMQANVCINIPKLKTHKKTGVTLSLKNLVGINGYRNCLPHHTVGSPAEAGDEYPDASLKRSLESRAIQAFKKVLARLGGTGGGVARSVKLLGKAVFGDTDQVIRSGNWYGNDACWRMVLDLNRCLLWHDGDGRPTDTPRRYLTVIDGLIGGEGDGPLAPEPVSAGLIIVGTNPWAVDWIATTEMGLSPERIPLLQGPLTRREKFAWLLPDAMPVAIHDGGRPACRRPFRPHFGWRILTGNGKPTAASQPD